MRSAFVSMTAVLILAVSVCIVSMMLHFRLVNAMDELCGEAIERVIAEDISGTMDYVGKLKVKLDESTYLMEMVASHDQLHEAMTNIIEARVALECEDMDDAYQALARLQGILDHIRDHEKLTISNLC
ncbi:MAG: DUF4363 family protein [Clostridia bacterium]|nr:DUF4363 family protein [Clostridia bacterium]